MKHFLSFLLMCLVAILLTRAIGCASKGSAPAVSSGEIRAWDAILSRSVAVVRASVAAQPPGDRRDKILAVIDQVQNWEQLGAAVSEAVAAGFEVSAPATQPTTQPVH